MKVHPDLETFGGLYVDAAGDRLVWQSNDHDYYYALQSDRPPARLTEEEFNALRAGLIAFRRVPVPR